MNITDFMAPSTLQRIQELLSNATGLAAIFVDADGKYITQGSNFTDFCMKYTRGCDEGLRRCAKCDAECRGTYFCHAGLMDFSVDIMVAGQKAGAIIGGQVLPGEPDLGKFRQIAVELGIDPETYIFALEKVPVRPEKTVRAAADLLDVFINQLANAEYLRTLNAKKIEVFDREMPKALGAVGGVKSKITDLQRVAAMENLLALNASVEAARAGHAGTGFAVVAREIGELSKNSSATYGEIESLIHQIEASISSIGNVTIR